MRLCSETFDEDFVEMFRLLLGFTHILARIEGELASHACWVMRLVSVISTTSPECIVAGG